MNGTQETLRSCQRSAQSARTEAGTKKSHQKLEGKKDTVRGEINYRINNLTGMRFGKLLVIGLSNDRLGIKQKKVGWECLCDCGRIKVILGQSLSRGATRSCGCIREEAKTASVDTVRKNLIHKWKNMMGRCYDQEHNSYHNYGARGIGVCGRWRKSKETFILWAVENGYEEGLQIDKIDNDGDYSPENCRFITHYENQHNQQPTRRNNSSGYSGVGHIKRGQPGYMAYIASITINRARRVYLGNFSTKKAALEARNNFIRDNNLPHRIQEYHGE